MIVIWNIVFLQEIFLYALLPCALLIVFLIWRREKRNTYRSNIVPDIKKIFRFHSVFFYGKLLLLFVVISSFLLLLADPHTTNTQDSISKNGIDIAIALDLSKSMEAQDLTPSRMEAAKFVVEKFIKELSSDRAGLVVFAGKPYTSVPLTFDYSILEETLKWITTDSLNQWVDDLNGTAIWDALLMTDTILHPKNSKDTTAEKNREKVIILLTDGDANRWADPILVSKSLENIKIYTVGIGSLSGGLVPFNFWWVTQYQQIPPLNESALRQIADITHGKFFRATDNQTFSQIFDELSKLDKHDIKVDAHKEYATAYKPFVYILLISLLLFTLTNLILFKD